MTDKCPLPLKRKINKNDTAFNIHGTGDGDGNTSLDNIRKWNSIVIQELTGILRITTEVHLLMLWWVHFWSWDWRSHIW
jgi:hypothetical protein